MSHGKLNFELSEKRRAVLQAMLQNGNGRPESVQRIGRRQPDKPAPLSFAQERLWFLDQFDQGNAAYNVPTSLPLRGPISVRALEYSLTEIVRRHEVLRTTFSVQEGEPVQVVGPAEKVEIKVRDVSGEEVGQREREAQLLAAAEARQPFNLRTGPLLRASLLRLGEEEHILLLTLHHIVCDGWSMEILFRELAKHYEGYCAGRSAGLAELPIQYGDYARWQREWLQGEVLEEHLGYWKEAL